MSGSAADRLARLLALVPWLKANDGVTIEQAAEAFSVNSSELEADLWLLIVCGLPGQGPGELIDIQFWGDDRVIHVIDPQTLGEPMRLRTDEAVSLLVGLRLLRELPGTFDRTVLDGVTDKLEELAGEAAAASRQVAVSISHTDDADVRSTIEAAVAQQRRLLLNYLVPARDEITEREVDPIRIVAVDGRVYLEGWCHRAQDLRTFRFDRIVKASMLEVAADTHEPRGDASTAAVFSASAEDVTVVVDLGPRARWIADYATTESTEELAGGLLRVTLRTSDTRWIKRLLLQCGNSATVIEPATLATEINADAMTALAAYS